MVGITNISWLPAVAVALGFFALTPARALAHCDGVDGPVVKAAQKALQTGDLVAVTEGLDRLREEGNGAVRQKAAFARTGRLADVVAEAVRVTACHLDG